MTVLTAYRVLAYVTGTVLLVLVCVAMPLKYLGDNPEPTSVIGQVHGFLFAVYALCVLLLAYVRRWTLGKAVLVVLAGTIPFVTFYAERKVAAAEAGRTAAPEGRARDGARG